MDNLPDWIKIEKYDKQKYIELKDCIEKNNLKTVCVEANCPNRYECFSKGTATFMILGDTCTRNCKYCNIKKGKPQELDLDEPKRIAEAVKKLNLKYVVITCVTRDDLFDGGAEHFAKTITKIKQINPGCKVEVLISDLKGNWTSLKKILDAGPDVLNHNIEVVKDIFTNLRPLGDYTISLELLSKAKQINKDVKTKSGFMLGLGENKSQIIQTIKDLKSVGCDILTLGQYLRPGPNYYDVQKYYSPKEFLNFKNIAKDLGINYVVAGPLVRSSYNASEIIN